MARGSKKKYENELIEVIKKHKIVYFDHCFAFTSFSRATAYKYNLDKIDYIKEAIIQNRVKAKTYMINKWIASDNPTLQIAAMRLIATKEEHMKLNQHYIDHATNGETINIINLGDGKKPD